MSNDLEKEKDSVVTPPPIPDTVALDFDSGTIDPLGEEFAERARARFYAPEGVTPAIAKLKDELKQMQFDAAKVGAMEEAVLSAQAKTNLPNRVAPMVWQGTHRDLVELFLEAFRAKSLKANSEQDVLRQLGQHFVDKNGKPLNPESLRVNFHLKRQEDRGKR
jgi:hypothetical protein